MATFFDSYLPQLQFYQSVGFKAMPVPKGGEERRQEFTSVKGENFSLWVLFLSEPGQA
jgi:hypothetical protein